MCAAVVKAIVQKETEKSGRSIITGSEPHLILKWHKAFQLLAYEHPGLNLFHWGQTPLTHQRSSRALYQIMYFQDKSEPVELLGKYRKYGEKMKKKLRGPCTLTESLSK